MSDGAFISIDCIEVRIAADDRARKRLIAISPPPELSHRLIDQDGWLHIGAHFALSGRELQVVQHIFDGHGESRIAFLLEISPHTVHTYVKRIYAKLGVCDHRELILTVVTEHFVT